LAGVSAGMLLGGNVVELYRKFFRFPALILQTDYAAIGVAVVKLHVNAVGVSGASGKRCGCRRRRACDQAILRNLTPPYLSAQVSTDF
jgi:hypothetical protein